MSQPKATEVPAEDLAPYVVYLTGGDQRMLVLETGENAESDDGPGEPSRFVVARSLLSDELDHHHAVSRREMFRVVDGKSAIRDAGDYLDDQIRRTEAVLEALDESDPARADREEQLARDREQREWLADQARQCGVRLRAS